jgi:hypothetical protein
MELREAEKDWVPVISAAWEEEVGKLLPKADLGVEGETQEESPSDK